MNDASVYDAAEPESPALLALDEVSGIAPDEHPMVAEQYGLARM